jgi:Asp-tRNA(Asn)/Glu-tRNA(Gln) amidotransferase A subunit family amidase
MTETTDLCYLSGTEAMELFRTGKLSPRELLDAILARAEAVEPEVNALSERFIDEARAAASSAEAAYGEGSARPLEGLPLAVKEDTAIEGRRTTAGSLIYKDDIADHTNPSIARLTDAGAVLYARATCPEFVWPWSCTSRLNGTTRNPWNLDITSGASSGGSAAALAAGTTTIATGTDSAGSIRMPAGMCGVVGYKPPHGRNPQSPWASLDFYYHTGPMTRTVADCLAMQNVMAGPHRADQASVKPKLTLPTEMPDIKGMRIAASLTLDHHAIDDDVRRNTQATLRLLEDLGAHVEEISMPWASRAIKAAGGFGSHLYSDWFASAVEQHGDLVCDYTKVFAKQCAGVTAAQHHDCYVVGGEAWLEFSKVFETYDAFICPTVATTRAGAEIMPWDDDLIIDGQKVSADGAWVMTKLFNMFSRCPALAVPSGLGDNGVPTGIQIVADTFEDARVFQVALALEAVRPWYGDAALRPAL